MEETHIAARTVLARGLLQDGPGGTMKKDTRRLKQLELKKETLRTLVDAELQKIAGGGTGTCYTMRFSTCTVNA